MILYADLCSSFLTQKEVHFETREFEDGTVMLSVPFSGYSVTLFFMGDDQGQRVTLRCILEHCPTEKTPDMLITCNTLNSKYRWLKFYLDSDNDIVLQDDAILEPQSAGDECFELLLRAANITKEVRPTIMGIVFGNN